VHSLFTGASTWRLQISLPEQSHCEKLISWQETPW